MIFFYSPSTNTNDAGIELILIICENITNLIIS